MFLQHGIYEMRRTDGNLKRAGELLHRAHELLPNSALVTHAYAELELKRGIQAVSPLVREKHLKASRSLVSSLIGRNARRPHGYHTAFKIDHARLRAILGAQDTDIDREEVAKAVRNAESMIADGLQQFPGDAYLLSAEAELANTLADDARAIDALERAAATNIKNIYVVTRLAKTYRRNEQDAKARALLEKAVDSTPYDRSLNYLLGTILLDADADGNLIEYHLRRGFNDGDYNYEAQFWYARQLFINGKEEEARIRFAKLRDARMSPKLRWQIHGDWMRGGTLEEFTGRLVKIEQRYAQLERDGIGDTIYMPCEDDSNSQVSRLVRGQRVRFTLAFNMLGPVARNVRAEGA